MSFQSQSIKLGVVSQEEDDETIEGETAYKNNEVWQAEELSETELLKEVLDISDKEVGASKKRVYSNQGKRHCSFYVYVIIQ